MNILINIYKAIIVINIASDYTLSLLLSLWWRISAVHMVVDLTVLSLSLEKKQFFIHSPISLSVEKGSEGLAFKHGDRYNTVEDTRSDIGRAIQSKGELVFLVAEEVFSEEDGSSEERKEGREEEREGREENRERGGKRTAQGEEGRGKTGQGEEERRICGCIFIYQNAQGYTDFGPFAVSRAHQGEPSPFINSATRVSVYVYPN